MTTNNEFAATVKAVTSDMEALDVEVLLAPVYKAAADRKAMLDGIEAGRARLHELARQISAGQQGEGVDGEQAGDALLTGSDTPFASVEVLQSKRRGVEKGIADLRRREEEAAMIESAAQHQALAELGATVQPIVAQLQETARRAAHDLATCYAASMAIAAATASGNHRALADALREAVARAMEARIIAREPIEVPAEVIMMLAAGRDVMDALKRAIPTHIAAPDPAVDPAVFELGAQVAALRSQPRAA